MKAIAVFRNCEAFIDKSIIPSIVKRSSKSLIEINLLQTDDWLMKSKVLKRVKLIF